jgi:hypothetical protein
MRWMTDRVFTFCPVCGGEVEDISDEPALFEALQMGPKIRDSFYSVFGPHDKIGIQG